MATTEDLRAKLVEIAERSVSIKSACTNEEGSKLYLVLPVIGLLGYDFTNPFEVKPELPASFRDDHPERVDFAIMREGSPIIAVECKTVGTPLESHRGQLRSYFGALRSARVGILSDGIRFEFFTDIIAQNVMDEAPFLVIDMEAISRGSIEADAIEVLALLSKSRFDPNAITEVAELQHLRKRLREIVLHEFREPSEELCRVFLQKAEVKYARRSSMRDRLGSAIKSAMEQAIVVPVVKHLRAVAIASQAADGVKEEMKYNGVSTTDRERAVFRYVTRRLAYLAEDEATFAAIERVQYRDYMGKFAVYYENVRKGRLFDYIEGSNGYDFFIFPSPMGEVSTNNFTDIDEPLRAIFTARVRELGNPARDVRRGVDAAYRSVAPRFGPCL